MNFPGSGRALESLLLRIIFTPFTETLGTPVCEQSVTSGFGVFTNTK